MEQCFLIAVQAHHTHTYVMSFGVYKRTRSRKKNQPSHSSIREEVVLPVRTEIRVASIRPPITATPVHREWPNTAPTDTHAMFYDMIIFSKTEMLDE